MTMAKKASSLKEATTTSRSNRDCSERKHGCDVCKRRFFTRKDVKRHQVVHTGSRQFICCFCSHAFGRKDHLVRHEKKVHSQLAKGILTPLLINDQLSFGLIVPVAQEINSALNSSQLPSNETPDNLLMTTTDLVTTQPDPAGQGIDGNQALSPTTEDETFPITLIESLVCLDTAFTNEDGGIHSDERSSTPGDLSAAQVEETSSATSPVGSFFHCDSAVSSCATPEGSLADCSIFGGCNDIFQSIDTGEVFNLYDIDIDNLEELYPLETEDYFNYLD